MKAEKSKGILILEHMEVTDLVIILQNDIEFYQNAIQHGLRPMEQLEDFKSNLKRCRKLYDKIMEILH